jgi:hypothetical protein
VLDTMADLKLSFPRTGGARRKELQRLRKQLAK